MKRHEVDGVTKDLGKSRAALPAAPESTRLDEELNAIALAGDPEDDDGEEVRH